MPAPTTVASVCDDLLKSRLMSPDEVSALRQRWFRPNREGVNDTERFAKWLVMNQYLTELQTQLLLKGQAESLFFNQYKLIDRIGKGRMAGVYKAVDPDGKIVAIKVLPPSKAKNPETLARFQRESRLAMRLNHPNVVRTYAAGEANGMHYIVMEYIEGSTLEEVLQRRGQLTPTEAARIIGHALLGLQHLHEQQMIHRDLKPGNLMLASVPAVGKTSRAASRVVKIMDIGLGRGLFEEDSGVDDSNLTAAGSLLGTLDYMAPEQAKDAHSADIRADVYSLGCVLYHCLAGQPPYRGMPFLTRHKELPRPVRQLAPDVPDTLQQIVEQMLAPDPFQRYQSPAGAARAIRIFLNSEEQAAPPPETVVYADPKQLEEESSEQVAPTVRAASARKKPAPAENDQRSTLEKLWDEIMPNDRELIHLLIGIISVLLIEGVFFILTQRSIQALALVAFGVVVGVAGQWFLQRRKPSGT